MMREDTTPPSNVPYSWFDLQNREEKGFPPRPFGFIAPLVKIIRPGRGWNPIRLCVIHR